MLFNNYKYKPNSQLDPIEAGTPSYINTIGANVIGPATDLASFLTSFIPSDPNVKEPNVFQTLRESINSLNENPNVSTPKKIVGGLSWLVGSIPGFSIASKAVKVSSGLLGIAAKSPISKSLEGGLAWGISNYPTRLAENPNASGLEKTKYISEDVAMGSLGEYGLRKVAPYISKVFKDNIGEAITPTTTSAESLAVNESTSPSFNINNKTVNQPINVSAAEQDALNYTAMQEAVRHTELTNPNVLSDTHAENLIDELKLNNIDDIITNSLEEYKEFYKKIKNYENNVDPDQIESQINQFASNNYDIGIPPTKSREEFIKQFHPDNLDETIENEALLKKHINHSDKIEAYINCMMEK